MKNEIRISVFPYYWSIFFSPRTLCYTYITIMLWYLALSGDQSQLLVPTVSPLGFGLSNAPGGFGLVTDNMLYRFLLISP